MGNPPKRKSRATLQNAFSIEKMGSFVTRRGLRDFNSGGSSTTS
jgi:hypothetical protein